MDGFEPLAVAGARPSQLADPFGAGPPHPLALAAARLLMARLQAGEIAAGVSTSTLEGAEGGKMFGVLVAESADGQLGFSKAFSGKLQQRWDVQGYAPPVFDRALRESTEPLAEQLVRRLTAKIVSLRASPEWARLRDEARALDVKHREQDVEWSERRTRARAQRRLLRASAPTPRPTQHAPATSPDERPSPRSGVSPASAADLQARAQEAEHRRAKTRMRAEREPLERALAEFERRLRRLEQHRLAASHISSRLLYDSYAFESPAGIRRSLRELCAPMEPPSGTGDCAAPKLLVFARRHGLRPLALAEFWWGLPPRGGGRRQGELYPACVEKCGLVLPFLLGTSG